MTTEHQLTIDDAPRYRYHDPLTSKLAAREQTPEKLSAGRWLAMDALARFGPMTDHELAAVTGRVATSIGRRRTDLVQAGWAIATDDRRLSPSGTPSIVWRLTIDGLAVWNELKDRQDSNAP